MRILVTGGAGFIGSNLVEQFQGRAEVRVLDNLRSGDLHNLEGLEAEFINGSVTDNLAVRNAMEGVDYVFHLAAMVSVPESMDKPVECTRINTEGTLVVLEEARRAGVKKLVFSSSAAVYGDNPVVPKIESMLPEPKSPYAVTKLDGEYYCRMFNDEGWLQTACLRYFNVFGIRQDPASQYAAVVPVFIERAIAGEPLLVHGDGGQTRDFISVKDVAAANDFLAISPDTAGVYNLGCGQRITINQLAGRIINLTGSASVIEHGSPRPGDVRDSLASINRIQAAGFPPPGGFDNALLRMIDAIQDQRTSGTGQ